MLSKQVGKFVSNYGWAIFAGIVILLVLGRYDNGKYRFPNAFSGNTPLSPANYPPGSEHSDSGVGVKAAAPIGQNSVPASVQGMTGTVAPGGAAATQNIDPAELLPSDANSNWTGAPGGGDVMNVNMLDAGHFQGAVSSSLRNPNLQLRSEPPNPRVDTGAWNQSTIEPDVQRRTLDIGSHL